VVCAGKAGKPGKDTGDDEDVGVPLPDLDAVKADMMTHVERLKKSVAKLRGGEANPSEWCCGRTRGVTTLACAQTGQYGQCHRCRLVAVVVLWSQACHG
jgi:hypothetical protein